VLGISPFWRTGEADAENRTKVKVKVCSMIARRSGHHQRRRPKALEQARVICKLVSASAATSCADAACSPAAIPAMLAQIAKLEEPAAHATAA
jgi:hypothetical protein